MIALTETSNTHNLSVAHDLGSFHDDTIYMLPQRHLLECHALVCSGVDLSLK